MKLYSFAITPNNRKVESFIAHFDLPVDVQPVNFKARETQSDEFFVLNPMRKVPVLVDGDFTLFESNAILTYLAGQFPETHALPTDLKGRADVDRWLHWQSCHLMPFMGSLKTGAETDLNEVKPLLSVLELRLAGQDYLLPTLTVADFAVSAYLMSKRGKQLDYSEHPGVAAWRERMQNSKGFLATQMKKPPAA